MSNQPFDQDAPQDRPIPQHPDNPPTVHHDAVPAPGHVDDSQPERLAALTPPRHQPTIHGRAVTEHVRQEGDGLDSFSDEEYREDQDDQNHGRFAEEEFRDSNRGRREVREERRNDFDRHQGEDDFFDRFLMRGSRNGINFMMVLGLLFTLILPPFAVIFSYLGLRKAQTENSRTDAMLSVVGIVLGLIGMLFILFSGFQAPHMSIRHW